MTLPLWCGPGSDRGDDVRRARRYVALLSGTDSSETGAGSGASGTPDADLRLLDRLHAGDGGAFDQLYRTYVPRLLDFAERYVASDIAEDIVQTVLTSLWRRRHTVTVRSTISAYLFGAVRQEVLFHERHHRVVTRHASRGGEHASLAEASPPSTDARASFEELRTALREAIETLPDRTRDVLTLRWVDELQYAEIAEVLGISVSAAKMHIHRAQARVRPLLERFREP